MKKILLLSDTHSYIDDKILNHVKQADEVWHAGDIGDLAVSDAIANLKPLRAVYGNIDGTDIRSRYPLDLIFKIENILVIMKHIAGYPGRFNSESIKLIHDHKPQLFISGHSHILRVMRDIEHPGMLFMNPGAAGRHGFHHMRTMLQFQIDNGNIQNVEVIELGKRTAGYLNLKQ